MSAYVEMLPQLHAERQLLAIEAASVPHMKDTARQAVIRRHQRTVTRDQTTRARSAHEALLAAGIPVVRVPVAKPQPSDVKESRG